MRCVRNLTWFLAGMALVGALFISMLPRAHSEDLAVDLPKELPVTSTIFFSCEYPGQPQIVALIATFKDGSVIRIDANNMHGIPNAKYVAAYGDMAADKKLYGVGNCGATKT